jgi:hypothetical protein
MTPESLHEFFCHFLHERYPKNYFEISKRTNLQKLDDARVFWIVKIEILFDKSHQFVFFSKNRLKHTKFELS